ncbi:MAG: hypothetical protein WDM88_01875 [Galbitalea sp.]
MSAADVAVAPERTFLALTYFELAYLLSSSSQTDSIVRSLLPLPNGINEAEDYLATGRALLAARMSVFPDGGTSYASAITLVVDGLSRASKSVMLSLGGSEPTIAAAFSDDDVTIEVVSLPGGQLLLGALSSIPLDATVLPSYSLELGADSMQLLAVRPDGGKLWLSYSDGVLRGASGDSFDLKPNGPTWREAVKLIFEDIDAFLSET